MPSQVRIRFHNSTKIGLHARYYVVYPSNLHQKLGQIPQAWPSTWPFILPYDDTIPPSSLPSPFSFCAFWRGRKQSLPVAGGKQAKRKCVMVRARSILTLLLIFCLEIIKLYQFFTIRSQLPNDTNSHLLFTQPSPSSQVSHATLISVNVFYLRHSG